MQLGVRTRRALARRRRRVAGGAVVALVALTVGVGGASPAHAESYGAIEGAGSTWSQVIVDQWIADVSANGMTVTYSGGGSSVGRQKFGNGVTDFAITEIPYQGRDPISGQVDSTSRPYAYLPIVAGGTAFTYHLEQGGQLLRDIRLSGDTLAKIFTNRITSWADPAIKADNNGRVLPDVPIRPVVRSDGSGTTAQFTTWLDNQHRDVWTAFNGGRTGLTSYWPAQGAQVPASGSDGVMNTVAGASGNGTIAYVEYSYPVNKNYPVVKVLNSAGYYVEPTQYAVAVGLTKARINTDASSPMYLTQILDDVYTNPDPRAYPLSSYSYMVLPIGADDSRMSTNKRQTLVDFMFYSLCEGQSKAGPYGYSPLPLNLVQAGFEQLARLGAADPKVNVADRDATRCNNPTFVAGDLSRNHLAEIADQPAACDQQGQGPCLGAGQSGGGGGTGAGGSGGSGGAGAGGGGAAGGTGGTGTGGAGSGGAGGGAAVDPETGQALVDPETGLALGADGAATGGTVTAATSTALGVRPAGSSVPLAVLAAAELLAVVLVPGLLAGRRRVRGAR